MFARLMMLLVVALGGMQIASAQHPRKVFDPNDPEKTRAVVPREERERLGLAAKTWDGVVQPEVYTALDRLNKILERAKEANTVEAIRTLDAIQFHGTVYVQVRLKHEPNGKANSKENRAALADVQRRVLGSLTAAEFHVRQLFERSPGLVGYASAEGLAKLAVHPDVVGVCLDDQPLPEPAPVVYGDQVPDPEPGEFAEEPGVKAGRVEVKVIEGLKQSDRLFVSVGLQPKGEPLPMAKQKQAVRELQDRVLGSLTADDFWLWTRFRGLSAFYGYINREGLDKLWKHPEVRGIGLEERIWLDPREMSRGRPKQPRRNR